MYHLFFSFFTLGEITLIRRFLVNHCAFITFKHRENALEACNKLQSQKHGSFRLTLNIGQSSKHIWYIVLMLLLMLLLLFFYRKLFYTNIIIIFICVLLRRVGNLCPTVNEKVLKATFEQFGRLLSIHLYVYLLHF